MNVVSSEHVTPVRLTCSGCCHWELSAMQTLADAESTGRCGRFGETRPASARPRCNICWEPAIVARPMQDGALADD